MNRQQPTTPALTEATNEVWAIIQSAKCANVIAIDETLQAMVSRSDGLVSSPALPLSSRTFAPNQSHGE